MPKIVVKRKAEIHKEFQIRPFQNRITIGTEGDNDLVINDKKISMHHLLIEKEGTQYFVTDTDSAFGSFLNGNRIEAKSPLKSGDEIVIGEHTLFFENVLFEKGIDDSPVVIEPTVESISSKIIPDEKVLSASAKVTVSSLTLEEQKPGKEVTPTGQLPYYLIAIYGPYIGKKYHINTGITRIGRDNTLNDIVIRENGKGEIDTSISRRHATITYENDGLYITDKRSKTRTYVNQQKLEDDSVVKLYPDDEIEIVSDQKSTIFRLVQEGLWDNAPPRKVGDWWLRNSRRMLTIISGLLIGIFFINIILSWKKLSLILQKPAPFKAEEQVWFTEDNALKSNNSAEEISKQIFSLTPLIGMVNDDRINDVVYIDKIGYLHVINGANREHLWPVNYKYRIQFPLQIVLADLNGNKLDDIVIPGIDSRVYAIDGRSGIEMWSSSIINGELSGAPLIADLNGDKLQDVIFCTRQGEVFISYSTYGEPKWMNHQTNSEIRCTPAAGDFNGDGLDEVAIGTENGEVFIFNGVMNKFSKIIDLNEELQKAKGSFFEDHQIRGHISVGKIDDDHADDLVITTQQANIIALSGSTFKRIWFDEFITDEPLSTKLMIPAALGDIDNDHKMDAIVFTYDNKIVAYRSLNQSSRQKKISWGYMPEINENFIAHPVIADVNKDGHSDLIAAGIFGGLYILDGKNGKMIWRNEGTGNIDEAIISTPLVADLDGNENLDILIRRANNQFCKITTNSKIPESTIWWSQIDHNAQHTGCLERSGLSSSNHIISILYSILIIAGIVAFNFLIIKKRNRYFVTT